MFKIGVEVEGTRLTPIKYSHRDDATWYWFRCRCGNVKLMRKGNVYHNKTRPIKSCGCLKKEVNQSHDGIGFKKGHVPWHAGKKVGAEKMGKNGGGWNKGKVKVTNSDGIIEWLDLYPKLPPDTGGHSLPGEKPR